MTQNSEKPSSTYLNRQSRNFKEKTKRLLAERVAYICCNPLCRRLTIKPHSTEQKANKLGDAGHIFGASNQGPRYDPTKLDSFLQSYNNGIWLCKWCHKLVDTEISTYDSQTLLNWKAETETYVESLTIQDTRLRQLRLFCQKYLSSLRILSGLPTKLDHTFENPNGNGINLTRLFMELELVLYDNEFLEEADFIRLIALDLDRVVCPFVHNNTGRQLNITEWKNIAVNILMSKVMRLRSDSYNRYLSQESAHVNIETTRFSATGLTPFSLELGSTELGKLKPEQFK